MPFFKPAKKIKKDCVSLQVHQSIKRKEKRNKIKMRKRVCLFTSCGSITLEASIVATVFIFAMLFMISFIILLNIQITTQIHIDNIAMAYAKKAFYLDRVKEVSDYHKQVENADENIENLKQRLKNLSFLFYQTENMNILDSRFENEVVDVVLKYKIKIPFIHRDIPIKQRAYVKDWSGTDIIREQKIVYLAETGKVYHSTKNCSHLVVNIRKTSYGKVGLERNKNGSKYSRCMQCVTKKVQNSSDVFVTEDGNKYHISLMCGKIKRTIIELDIKEVEGMKGCSSCVKGG